MSSDDEQTWYHDHGYEENPEEATKWENYREYHYPMDETDVPVNVPNAFLVHLIFGIAPENPTAENASGELMAIDVDPQDRVWYISRGAKLPSQGDTTCQVGYLETPDAGLADPTQKISALNEPTVALELDVMVGAQHVEGSSSGQSAASAELGGQSVVIDPNFEENGYVYVFYTPASGDIDTWDNPYNEDIYTGLHRISRFEFDGEVLDPDSEEVIIEIPKQLHTCCHNGGYMEFGPDGNLYITSGDDSNNNGNPDKPTVDYSMTDEREGDVHGRPAAVSDAQRTSGNTADLRGSVLRIDVNDDGSYDIPEGNLKEHWEEQTGETYSDEEFRPEIYVMGMRNPFVVSVDDHTGWLHTASYGNDAPSWDSDLGTVGQANHHLWDEPGNAGHPFFKAYYPNRQYDYEAGESRQPFWPDNLRNKSRNNTGIENVPNVTPGLIWHPQSSDEYTNVAAWADMPRPGEVTWPQLDDGGSADAGVTYRYKDEYGQGALDPYFDGKPFFQNPQNQNNLRYMTFTEDGRIEIKPFLPDTNNTQAAHDMDVLSDGRLVIMGMYSGIHLYEYTGPEPQPKEGGA